MQKDTKDSGISDISEDELGDCEVEIFSSLPVKDVVDSLIEQLSYEELFAAVVEIDELFCDYDFTKRLRDHFSNVIDQCARDDEGDEGDQIEK